MSLAAQSDIHHIHNVSLTEHLPAPLRYCWAHFLLGHSFSKPILSTTLSLLSAHNRPSMILTSADVPGINLNITLLL